MDILYTYTKYEFSANAEFAFLFFKVWIYVLRQFYFNFVFNMKTIYISSMKFVTQIIEVVEDGN